MSSHLRLLAAFAFSFLNFAFLGLSALVVGGLGHWSLAQFGGLYGILEASIGIANLVAPNFWALPVSEFRSRSETTVVLALADLRTIHIDGLGRVLGGGAFMTWSLIDNGIRVESLLLPPLIALLSLTIVALSGLIARWGIARPEIDVLQFKVYWLNREKIFPPISLGTSYLQFFLTLIALPIAASASPRFLFHPELFPTVGLLGVLLIVAAVSTVLFLVAWSSRIVLRPAPAPAQSDRVINPAALEDSSERS